jgi:hypothetical protein
MHWQQGCWQVAVDWGRCEAQLARPALFPLLLLLQVLLLRVRLLLQVLLLRVRLLLLVLLLRVVLLQLLAHHPVHCVASCARSSG